MALTSHEAIGGDARFGMEVMQDCKAETSVKQPWVA